MMGPVQPPTPTTPGPGVLTKTFIRTPVCNFILHARIRHRDFNDVVFVGEDFIHVKQVKQNGHLEHIATKDNFESRIVAAKTFTVDADASEDGGDFIKTEPASGKRKNATFDPPPQLLLLTCTSGELICLYLKDDAAGERKFIHEALLLPPIEHTLHEHGVHLAVDPASRAIAVAAHEGKIVIYSAKPTAQIKHEMVTKDRDWYPIASERAIPVTGVIQHLEFLHPPDKDPDHVILLVILVDQRRKKAAWIDWYHPDTKLWRANFHPAQPLDVHRAVSNLLIPLRNAAFLTVTGSEMKLHKNILSGSMKSVTVDPLADETESRGSSSRPPIWTSWCRPLRNKSIKHGQDIVYLIREDGLVILVEITTIDTIHASHAGNVGCHAGSAFASLGDPSDPDILAVGGNMSNGRVVHIGNWPSPGRIVEMSRIDTMEMQESEILPNWASGIDMLVSKLSQLNVKSPRITDSIFITSGREPYGSITELRTGIEARLATYFDLDGLKSVVGAWVLPNISTGSIVMLLSTPSSTRLLDIAPSLEELDELTYKETTALELQQCTLAAGMLHNGHLVQVSEKSIRTCATILANFEDRSRWDAVEENTIIAAAIESSYNCTVIVQRMVNHTELLAFKHHVQRADEEVDEAEEGLQLVGKPLILEDEPLCLATSGYESGIVGVTATVEGSIQLFFTDFGTSSRLALQDSRRIVRDRQSLCDHVALIHPITATVDSPHVLLAVCGLRDGTIVCIEINTTDDGLRFGENNTSKFGHETVRLQRPAGDNQKAYAFCGLATSILTWDGANPSSIKIQNLFISDRSRPALSQGPITMVSTMPSSDYLSGTETIGSLAGTLAIISSNEVCFALVGDTTTTIPRQIQVTGTPHRVIYAEQQRSIVCASVCTGVRSFPSNMRNAQPEERRQIWPAIDFIPANKDGVSFTFDFQPGERVYALLEWSFMQKDKLFSSIMVGGSYTKPDGTERGRIAFLQPTNRNWEIVDVREGRSTNFERPVYALALYDKLTYLACSGSSISASRFDTEERKWENICAPLQLTNKGTSISVSAPLIYVSIASDGIVTLRLEEIDDVQSNSKNRAYSHRLTLVAQPPRADKPLSHTVIPLKQDTNIALLSTSNSLLLGLTSPPPDVKGQHRTRLLFEAQLPRSIIRIKQGRTRPAWRSAPTKGVITSDLLGLSTDGSMTGISLIDEHFWRRLFWLQRIIEWDKTFSPHAPALATYGVNVEHYTGGERGVPIGLVNAGGDEIALFSVDDVGREADRHIDGDVLARVLVDGGVERLEAAVRRMAERDDRVGQWVRMNLESEVGAVSGVVEEVKGLFGMWM